MSDAFSKLTFICAHTSITWKPCSKDWRDKKTERSFSLIKIFALDLTEQISENHIRTKISFHFPLSWRTRESTGIKENIGSKWVNEDAINISLNPFKCQPHKMVKHTQIIRRQKPTNCFIVLDHFVGLALKGLSFIFLGFSKRAK